MADDVKLLFPSEHVLKVTRTSGEVHLVDVREVFGIETRDDCAVLLFRCGADPLPFRADEYAAARELWLRRAIESVDLFDPSMLAVALPDRTSRLVNLAAVSRIDRVRDAGSSRFTVTIHFRCGADPLSFCPKDYQRVWRAWRTVQFRAGHVSDLGKDERSGRIVSAGLSCVMVEVLMAAYVGNQTAKDRHTAPSYVEALAFMKGWEAIDQDGEITERGRVWVESILATPVPVPTWKDPRF